MLFRSTNDLHGSLFEFLRNDNLDAPRWEDNKSPNGQPEFRRNQFGGSLGGPILKDKLFFFLSYDDFKRVSAPPQANFIPDATQLAAVVARAQAAGGYVAGDLSADNVAFQKTTIAKLDWNALEGQRVSFTYRKKDRKSTRLNSSHT